MYDYGEIGHFWVKGAEYLRQIEYKIAIVRDKLDYLEKNTVIRSRRSLQHLQTFPHESLLLSGGFGAVYCSERGSVDTVCGGSRGDTGTCSCSKRRKIIEKPAVLSKISMEMDGKKNCTNVGRTESMQQLQIFYWKN